MQINSVTSDSNRHAGLTVIELIVVLAILIVMATLAMASLFSSREAARAITCVSNQRQIGAAINSYEAAFRSLPAGALKGGAVGFGTITRILPYLDNQPLAAMIPWDTQISLDGSKISDVSLSSVATCPSDASADHLSLSYVVNGGAGAGMLNPSLNLELSAPNLLGAFDFDNLVRLSDFRDGAAQTAMLSERSVGAERGRVPYHRSTSLGSPPRDLADLGDNIELPPTVTNKFLTACAAIDNTHPDWIRNHGRRWLWERHYNHAQPPNAPILDCAYSITYPLTGIITARSFHKNSVVVLFADGHVSNVNDTIDRKSWAALGTRDAGDESPSQPE